MKARPRMRLRLWLAALACGAVLACNTPSVPLPPPSLSGLTFMPGMEAGTVVLTGKPNSQLANAMFHVQDDARGKEFGTRAAADGSFTTDPFVANDGDLLRMYYDSAQLERSEDVCAHLVENSPLLSVQCP
jgi:hypothetical protein